MNLSSEIIVTEEKSPNLKAISLLADRNREGLCMFAPWSVEVGDGSGNVGLGVWIGVGDKATTGSSCI